MLRAGNQLTDRIGGILGYYAGELLFCVTSIAVAVYQYNALYGPRSVAINQSFVG